MFIGSFLLSYRYKKQDSSDSNIKKKLTVFKRTSKALLFYRHLYSLGYHFIITGFLYYFLKSHRYMHVALSSSKCPMLYYKCY